MGATVTVTRSEVVGRQRVREFDYTGDSSYPRGGEAFLPGAVALSTIDSVSRKVPGVGIVPAYDPVGGKLKFLAKQSPVGVTRAFLHAGAPTGVVVYVHVPTPTVDMARETGVSQPVVGWLEFISPTTTDGSFLLSNGDAVTIFHDAAAATAGNQVFLNEAEATISPLQADVTTLLRDVLVRTQGGNYILISHKTGVVAVAVKFTEAAADASKLQFISPTTTSLTVNVDPEVTPGANHAGITAKLVARGF